MDPLWPRESVPKSYEISKPPITFYKPELHTQPYIPPGLATKILTEASKYYTKKDNMQQFLENIQNAIAIEIKKEGAIEGSDLQTAAQMAMLAYSRLSENDQAVLRHQLEHPHQHEFLRESAPKWYKKTITDYHD